MGGGVERKGEWKHSLLGVQGWGGRMWLFSQVMCITTASTCAVTISTPHSVNNPKLAEQLVPLQPKEDEALDRARLLAGTLSSRLGTRDITMTVSVGSVGRRGEGEREDRALGKEVYEGRGMEEARIGGGT